MPPPSYADPRGHGAAHRPACPPTTSPAGPPAHWRGADGQPFPAAGRPDTGYPGGPASTGPGVPGYGSAAPGYPGAAGLGGVDTQRYGAPDAPGGPAAAEAFRHGPPAQPAGLHPPGGPGYAAPAAPAYRGGEVPGYGVPATAPRHAPEPAAYGAPQAAGYGTPAASVGAPAAWPSTAPAGGHPTSGRSVPAADGYSSPAVQDQIRQAVVHRVQYANALHASHYWDLRRTKPVGPHALVFLYASLDPRFSNPRRPYYEIKAASRLFRDGADVQDLPALLYELTEIAKGYLADGGVFDPVPQMTQAAEPVPTDATYVGVAVSTLFGSGEAVVEEPLAAVGGMGIPGRGMVVLADNNLLVVERPARAHEQVEVYATFPYFTSGGVEYRSWRPFSPEQQADPSWRWLQHLNQLVVTGQERKAAAVAAGGGRRRR